MDTLQTAEGFKNWEAGKGALPTLEDAPQNANADLQAMADRVPDRKPTKPAPPPRTL